MLREQTENLQKEELFVENEVRKFFIHIFDSISAEMCKALMGN
jgi:hypothetical protein